MGIIIPIDELIFLRGVKPPTRQSITEANMAEFKQRVVLGVVTQQFLCCECAKSIAQVLRCAGELVVFCSPLGQNVYSCNRGLIDMFRSNKNYLNYLKLRTSWCIYIYIHVYIFLACCIWERTFAAAGSAKTSGLCL